MEKKLIVNLASYFFEVLVKSYLQAERDIEVKGIFKKIIMLFKKINFLERANNFKKLYDLAEEAQKTFPDIENIKNDNLLYSLALKLYECYAIYIDMVKEQIGINEKLNLKAEGGSYEWSEYTKNIKMFDMLRNSLEKELPTMNTLYTKVLITCEKEGM